MSNIFENKGAMTATVVVAAADSLNQAAANYVCDGTADNVEVQAALDALPATGGEVVLLEGTYYIEAAINLNSYQKIRGLGHNTILTTTTANMVILSAIGAFGSELTHIEIADLQIDGDNVADCGIYFEYVNYSLIQNVYSHDNTAGGVMAGLIVYYSHYNKIIDNILQSNMFGAFLDVSNYNIFSENSFQGNGAQGLAVGLHGGCYINLIVNNIFDGNGFDGLGVANSDHNVIEDNEFFENSQDTTNTYDDIILAGSDYNLIQGNLCRAGNLANVPRYGINISNASCDSNEVIDNDLYNDGFGTAPFNDAGTGTKLNVFVSPFTQGSTFATTYGGGFVITGASDYAWTALRLPDKVHQVVRMKIYAMTTTTEVDHMRLELEIFGAADNEPYNTHDGSIANHPSTSVNFAANDIVFWTVTTAGVLALLGGDSVVVRAIYEAAGGDDCDTDGRFRTVEIEYV